MKKKLVVLLLLGALLLAGCCESNPNLLAQIKTGYDQAQALVYGVDGQLLPNIMATISNPLVLEGVAAGDLVLALGGMAQESYCAATAPVAAQVTAATATAAARLGK